MHTRTVLLVFASLLIDPVPVAGRLPSSRLLSLAARRKQSSEADIRVPQYTWTTSIFAEMPIDHFSYRNTETFHLKYLTNFEHHKPGGPIFFYTGNEGAIEGFAENTGIIWDLAPHFGAAIVFAEHRFYGDTMPFGNQSYANVTNLGYLDSIQALADFAQLIQYIKSDVLKCSDDTPVIAFGGSYGAMLSAWMRMKYPNIITGSWASSAPLLYFEGSGVSPSIYDNITTRTFVDSGCSREAFSNGFPALQRLTGTENGRKFLNALFQLDPASLLTDPSGFYDLYDYINSAMVYMAMTDYPYSANFVGALPGWPVKYACQFAKQAPNNDTELAIQLYNVMNVFYNFTGTLQYNCISGNCATGGTSVLSSSDGWPWQSCTEIVMLLCDSGGQTDFFIDNCNVDGGVAPMLLAGCLQTFTEIGYVKQLFNLNAVAIRYGLSFAATSNTVFTNGYLDPWSGGGVYADSPGIKHAMKNGVYTFYIQDSAHHLDLRQPNTCDPPSVINARYQIVNIIACWINPKCLNPPKATALPSNSKWKQPNKCESVVNGFPWNQKPSSSERLHLSHFVLLIISLLTFSKLI